MKSYNQSRDGSNLIRTILDYYWCRISQDWLSHQSHDLPNQPSKLRINFLNQPFESTFWNNLCNQPYYWIGGATSLWYIASSDKHAYVRECTPTDWGRYDLGG